MEPEGVQNFGVFFDRVGKIFRYTQVVYVEIRRRGQDKRI